ncbi:MAG: NAD(P)-binding domain-containing protein [Frankia sp.]|nr:NAD(P)-binding domain-containing protein [Frankia sp.]
MRIGILGSGAVGQALARGHARHGHETRIGTRKPDKPDLAEFATGTVDAVAQWGELLILAVDGSAAEALARDVASAAAGKVLIDATNPLDFSGGVRGLFVGTTDSLGERVQRAAPDARVVKAYNIVGNAQMVDPEISGGPPTMLIAGNDDDAKASVLALLEDTGWDALDIGDITMSRWLEPIALAWVAYGVRAGTWNHAFRLLRG